MESVVDVKNDSKNDARCKMDVLKSMQWFLDAADNYVKDKAYKSANHCFCKVKIIFGNLFVDCLFLGSITRIASANIRYENDKFETSRIETITHFLRFFPRCHHHRKCLRHQPSSRMDRVSVLYVLGSFSSNLFILLRPLYQQTVVTGNFTYLEEFLSTIPGQTSIFPELVKRVSTTTFPPLQP